MTENVEQKVTHKIITYEGELGYYFRQAGIEEGAHAVFFNTKMQYEKGSGNIQNAVESVNEINPKTQKNIIGARYMQRTTPIEDMSDEEIRELIDYSDDLTPSFQGNKDRALEYCRTFIDGALVPVHKMYKTGSPEVKFGLVVPREGENFYDFFYHLEMNTIFINRSTLEEMSQYPSNISITASGTTKGYDQQSHEKRALLWQIQDAKKHGQDRVVELLRKSYKGEDK